MDNTDSSTEQGENVRDKHSHDCIKENEEVVKDILKKYGDKWVVPNNLREIVNKVFQYKKGETGENRDKER